MGLNGLHWAVPFSVLNRVGPINISNKTPVLFLFPFFFAAARLSSFIQQEQQGQVTHDSAQVGQVFIRFYRVGWLDFY